MAWLGGDYGPASAFTLGYVRQARADGVSMATTNVTTSFMKVNPNRDLPATAPRVAKSQPAAKPSATPRSDFPAAAKLRGQLNAMPEVRAEQVARARKLIANPDYPEAQTIAAVAQQLASKINSSGNTKP